MAVRRLIIQRLADRGEGVADTEEGPVFVPFALPGETVRAAVVGDRGFLEAVEQASPARVAPVCPAFMACGGCVAQHMGAALQMAWKRDSVARALGRAGVVAETIRETVPAAGEGRRRVNLHLRFRAGGRVEAGFMRARSHTLLDLEACPVLVPALAPCFAVARRVAAPLAGRQKPLDAQITATEGGLDVDIRGHGPAAEDERRALATLADALDLARLSIHRDVVVERRPPLVAMGRAMVRLPPKSFLQPTAAGEAALAALVMEGVGRARPVADLFCGVGPFALRLAERAAVTAVDSDAEAIAALDRAVRHTAGLKPVTAVTRDLFRRPLLPNELAPFEAVVLDPPRAGAEAQVRALVGSRVPVVVSVSCDLGTFARDAARLVAGGYRLRWVAPVDQFAHSAHLETVALFTRR